MTSVENDYLVNFLESHRSLVIVLFCLPAGFVFHLSVQLIRWIERNFFYLDQSHHEKVSNIQVEVLKWNKLPKTERKLLCTARKNWQSLSTKFFPKQHYHRISVPLYNILHIDYDNLTVHVEPLVTVGDITKYLLPKGFSLAVHLEISEATLGGLALGVGMTTHSHVVGLYQETVKSYDVILSDGSLVHVTEDNEYFDLFKALPWSHGTLCFLVALELKIIPIKKYVHVTYIPVVGKENYCDVIRKLSSRTDENVSVPDFLEATVFDKNFAVVITGTFSDYVENLPINYVTRWYKPWFYKYVRSHSVKYEELIPLEDYLLRHNRSIFWVVEDMVPFGNNLVVRILLGWLFPPKVAFLKFTTTAGIRRLSFTKQVFQDVVLPLSKLEEQIDIAEELFDIYPLLVYPCKIFDKGPQSGQIRRPQSKDLYLHTKWAMYNDLGIYGVPGHIKKKRNYNSVEAMKKLEAFTRRVGGFPFLYADNCMTYEEFCQMFDLSLYEKVREKYKASDAFPHLYEKVKPELSWVVSTEVTKKHEL